MLALRASTRVLKNPGTSEAARRIADYKNPSTAKSYGRRWDAASLDEAQGSLMRLQGQALPARRPRLQAPPGPS